uniref:MADF domain-containing protein n=1 Tax=Angiostrongylus cantonensis TaxID=6313 RepID=A0A0K0DRN0_ANGCA
MRKDAKFKSRSWRTIVNWDVFNSSVGCSEDAAANNIDEKYDRLYRHHHSSAMKAESSKVTNRRLSPKKLDPSAWNLTSCKQQRTDVRLQNNGDSHKK